MSRTPKVTYGQRIAFDPHVTTGNEDDNVWSCTCGAGGTLTEAQQDRFVYLGDLTRDHNDTEVARVLPRLAPDQVIEALRRGEGDSQHVAATELVIAHGHWVGYGHLRRYMIGGWNSRDNALWLRISWGSLRAACGELFDLADALDNLDERDAARTVRRRAEQRAEADRGIIGSSSEIAVLRIAASIAGHGAVNLGSDTANLDNTNRGLVLTAIGHLLTHGGSVSIRSAHTWAEHLGGRS